MALSSLCLRCLLTILVLLSCASAEQELHLYYLRHPESQWNAKKFKAFHRDSRLSSKGIDQLEYLMEHFGNTIYDHMNKLLAIEDGSMGAKYRSFQFEASTLNRAQFIALAAWKSLIETAKAKSNALLLSTLQTAEYNIVQDLQEASFGIDAWSKMDKEFVGKSKEKQEKWMQYLARGFGKEFEKAYLKGARTSAAGKANPVWSNLFSDGFDTQFCGNARYVSAADWKHSAWTALTEKMTGKKMRIPGYAKRLKTLMDKKVSLVIIGGHSHWFMDFVAETTKNSHSKGAMEMRDRWGKEGTKVGNAHMVHVVVRGDGTSVEIKSLQQLFPTPPQQWTEYSLERDPTEDKKMCIVNY